MTTLDRWFEMIERTLDEVLPRKNERPAVLSSAMRYAVGSGGKRIRPLICLASAMAVGGKVRDARYPAAAIEILHNYTLVHDDLPAMDNDVERRGKPTVWKKFGEANAILAGDALLALAYRVAAKAPRNVDRIIDILGEKGVGVVQGQVEDIARSRKRFDVGFVYEHKTADLFIAAAVMGGLAGGGDRRAIANLRRFALNLGLAFQYEDDLLDGDYPYTKAKTERLVAQSTAIAVESLKALPGEVTMLAKIAKMLIRRNK